MEIGGWKTSFERPKVGQLAVKDIGAMVLAKDTIT